jgi:hypothetical protein
MLSNILEEPTGSELVFRLPLGASAAFPRLLTALDAAKQRLGVASYGLSVTTLEDVFAAVVTVFERRISRDSGVGVQ